MHYNSYQNIERFYKERISTLYNKYNDQSNIIFSIIPNSFRREALVFDNNSKFQIFAENNSITHFPLYTYNPEFTINGIKSQYLLDHEKNEPMLIYEIFENGYIEVVGICKELSSLKEKYNGACHPLHILRILINGVNLLKRVETFSTYTSNYKLVLNILNAKNFNLHETKDDYYNQNWKKIKYNEPDLEIQHQIQSLDMIEEDMIFPIFNKFYKAFNFNFCRYFIKGKFEEKFRNEL